MVNDRRPPAYASPATLLHEVSRIYDNQYSVADLNIDAGFEQFFDTPSTDSAAPQALGFEGFFRGAFSYHFHNFWCVLF